jgi:hypothetical protein
LWDDFVQLTRVTFENKINVLATKPTGEFKSWDKVVNDLKENHQVSFVFYYYLD